MADFNSEDLDKLSASIMAMNRTIVGLSKTIQEQQRAVSKAIGEHARVAGAQNQRQPQQPQQRPQPQKKGDAGDELLIKPIKGRPVASDGVNKDTFAGANAAGSALASTSKKAVGALGAINDSTVNTAKSLSKLDGEFAYMSNTLSGFKGAIGIMGAITLLSDVIGDTIDKYKALSDVGQSFGGSMLQMQIAASEARLPLSEFAEAITKYSKVIAVTGASSFGVLNKGLRDSLSGFGLLGMSTKDLTEFTGDYLEMQRKSGRLNRISDSETMENMRNMAVEASKVAAMTGESRRAILKNAMEAMQENSYMSAKFMLSADAASKMERGMITATTYLAGMPGEAGKIMNEMLSETVGKGSSIMSEQVLKFAQLGMGGVGTSMDVLAQKVKAGNTTVEDMESFRSSFLTEAKANMANLKYQADHNNDQDAKRIIQMVAEMESMSAQKMQELAQQQKVTNFFMNLQNNLQTITAYFREKFFKAVMGATNSIEDLAETPGFIAFKEAIGTAADSFGTWIGELLASPERINSFIEGVKDVAEGMMSVLGAIASVIKFVTPLFSMLGTAISGVVDTASYLIEHGKGWGIALVAAGAYMALQLKKFVTEFVKDAWGKFTGKGDSLMKNQYRNGALVVHVANGDTLMNSKSGGRGKTGRNGKNGKNGRDGRGGGSAGGKKRNNRVKAPGGATPSVSKGATTATIGRDTVSPTSDKKGRGGFFGSLADKASQVFDRATNRGNTTVADGDATTKTAPNTTADKSNTPDKPKGGFLDKLKGRVGVGKMLAGGAVGAAAQVGANLYAASDLPMANTAGVLADTASWAATGAMMGSVIPGVGNLVGGAVGALAGGGYSLYNNWDSVVGDFMSPKESSNTVDAFAGDATSTNAVSNSGNRTPEKTTPTVESIDASTLGNLGAGTNKELVDAIVSSNNTLAAALGGVKESVESSVRIQQFGLGTIANNTENKGHQVGSEFNG